MTDHYATLGLDRTATQAEIKAAYKREAMRAHPDRGGDPNRFHAVQEAFRALKSDKCEMCGGKGYVREPNGAFVVTKQCPICWGRM
jgi:DnaJ-class molecular chaperone